MLTITSINMFKPLYKLDGKETQIGETGSTYSERWLVDVSSLLSGCVQCVVLGLAHKYEAVKLRITFVIFFSPFMMWKVNHTNWKTMGLHNHSVDLFSKNIPWIKLFFALHFACIKKPFANIIIIIIIIKKTFKICYLETSLKMFCNFTSVVNASCFKGESFHNDCFPTSFRLFHWTRSKTFF